MSWPDGSAEDQRRLPRGRRSHRALRRHSRPLGVPHMRRILSGQDQGALHASLGPTAGRITRHIACAACVARGRIADHRCAMPRVCAIVEVVCHRTVYHLLLCFSRRCGLLTLSLRADFTAVFRSGWHQCRVDMLHRSSLHILCDTFVCIGVPAGSPFSLGHQHEIN